MTKATLHRDGTVTLGSTTIGSIERQLRQEGATWKVSWLALDTTEALICRQYSRKLALAAVVSHAHAADAKAAGDADADALVALVRCDNQRRRLALTDNVLTSIKRAGWYVEGSGTRRTIRLGSRTGEVVGTLEKQGRYWVAAVGEWTAVATSIHNAVWRVVYGEGSHG